MTEMRFAKPCPICGADIPVSVETRDVNPEGFREFKTTWEFDEPDLTDLWAHVWAHEASTRTEQ